MHTTLRALVAAAVLALPAAAQVTPTHPDLVYANLGGKDLLLDLYLPPGAGPHPVVVWIHGGGWSGGTRFPIPGGAAQLVPEGIAVASVDYRLTSQAGQYGAFPVTFPAQIEDVKGAVRWLRANAATYDLDPARFGAWGSSAGGHLAALLATSGSGTIAGLEGTTGGNLAHSSAVQAATDWFGPTNILTMNLDVTTPPGSMIDHDAPTSPESRLIGFDGPGEGIGVLRAHELDPTSPYPFYVQLAYDVDPSRWADAGDPPLLIAHGTSDTSVPFRQSTRLADALLAADVPHVLSQVIGAGHGLGGPNGVTARLFFVQQFFGTRTLETFCSADPASATCPCDNAGFFGHGCANSRPTSGGALLVAGGFADPSTLQLQSLGMPPATTCLFIQGNTDLATPALFGDGLRCVGGNVLRLKSKVASEGTALYPDPATGDASIQATSAARGDPIAPGSTRSYQVFFRDQAPGFCPAPQGAAFNMGNAVRVTW